MYEIKHRIKIDADAERVYEALATISGLQGWWTETTSGSCSPGGELEFRFGETTTMMRIESAEKNKQVTWSCIDSMPDWLGTRLKFQITPAQDAVVLFFDHSQWRESNELYALCNMKWATFLLSLKAYVESGEGRPFPRDVAI